MKTNLRCNAILLVFLFISYCSFGQWQVKSSATTADLVDGCFLNDSVGFVISSGGQLLKTQDKGETWNLSANLSGVFTSICKAGQDTLYVGGDKLYRSDDGGNTWNLLTTFTDKIVDIGFFNSKTGYIILPGTSNCFYYVNHVFDDYKMYKTADFGNTWQLAFSNLDSRASFQFVSDSVAYFTAIFNAINPFYCLNTRHNYIRKTSNQGANWDPISLPLYKSSDWFSYVNDTLGYYLDMFMNSIEKTTDGGNSFSSFYTEINNLSITQCLFLNSIDGYLKGTNKIYSTTSEGLTWTLDHTDVNSINHLFHNYSGIMLAIGGNGLILKKQIVPSVSADTVSRVKTNPDSLDFTLTTVGLSKTKTFTLKNTGNIPLSLSLNAPVGFEIGFDSISYSNLLSLALAPSKDTIIYVKFLPTAIQPYRDSIIISAPGISNKAVLVKGIGENGLHGVIAQDTVICVDTLNIVGNLTINNGVKLSICAGTYVKVKGNFTIYVNGMIGVLGNSLDSVIFRPLNDLVGWSGISIANGTYNDSSIFTYTDFGGLCNGSFLNISQGKAYVDHCRMSNLSLAGAAGAIKLNSSLANYTARIFLSNCEIYGNKGAQYSVICDFGDSSYFFNNYFHDNLGGLQWWNGKYASLANNIICNNTSMEGLVISGNVAVSKNKIFNSKGGIFASNASGQIKNNVIYNNESYLTGGISGEFKGSISQNLVFNNKNYSRGGGINLAGNNDTTFVISNTISNNLAEEGNNLYASTNQFANLVIVLKNNIFYGSKDLNNNIIWLPSVNYIVENNCVGNQDNYNSLGAGNINTDPQFVAPADWGVFSNIGFYDWSLKNNSLCINSGIPTMFDAQTDFVGAPRVFNDTIDIGAIEHQGLYIFYQTFENNVFPNPFSNTLDIYAPETGISEVTFYDAIGRIVLKEQFTFILNLNAEQFSRGIYLYKIVTASGIHINGKVLKAE